jgi:pimeloyl-ACP methyl ester carboxylesterase
MTQILRPFLCAVPDSAIADLNRRLDAARWPDEVQGVDWDNGFPLPVLRELIDHWRHHFDWRAAEARINSFDNFKIAIDGLDTHFIHQRSPHPHALPLLMTHGWPGSIVEFLDVIPRLVEPEKYGGSAEDAFHVICPSLPGYGFSDASPVPGMGQRQAAVRHLALMTLLGYDRFVAQGGDWGSIVSCFLANLAPDRLVGLHLNMMPPWRPQGGGDPVALMTEAERARYAQDNARLPGLTGYQAIQMTKPQTLTYGLADSPVGLAAWIGEKFHDWTDNRGDIRDALSFDQILTNIALYWFTNTIGSSVRFYREFQLGTPVGSPLGMAPLPRCEVPTGGAYYPREIYAPVKAWVEAQFNLVHWHVAERGGHFAAFEQPADFAADVRAFGATLRAIGAA